METVTDFIVTSKLSGLFVMPIIVSLVYALLFKSKRKYIVITFISLPGEVAMVKISDSFRQKTLI
jgi:hypothetical protein